MHDLLTKMCYWNGLEIWLGTVQTVNFIYVTVVLSIFEGRGPQGPIPSVQQITHPPNISLYLYFCIRYVLDLTT